MKCSKFAAGISSLVVGFHVGSIKMLGICRGVSVGKRSHPDAIRNVGDKISPGGICTSIHTFCCLNDVGCSGWITCNRNFHGGSDLLNSKGRRYNRRRFKAKDFNDCGRGQAQIRRENYRGAFLHSSIWLKTVPFPRMTVAVDHQGRPEALGRTQEWRASLTGDRINSIA
jgi:hypothetical protein